MSRRPVVFLLAVAWTATVCAQAPPVPAPLDAARDRPRNIAEFDRMFRELRNWGRWGKDDQLGTINLVTPAKTREAAALVKAGVSVSLSHNPITEAVPDSPYPSYALEMAGTMSDVQHFNYHGYVTSHIDSLCHFDWRGRLYNGVVTETNNTSAGCRTLGIEALKNGVVTRGVLLDIPRLRGVAYLEPGDAVFTRDIEAWEKKFGVTIGPGDALILYTGRWARRAKVGPWPLPGPVAGFHVSVGRFLKERDVAVVGSDAAMDVTPAQFDGLFEPLHHFVMAGLGAPILDALDLEAVAAAAAKLNRWEFMLTIAPIPAAGATGGPINVLATF